MIKRKVTRGLTTAFVGIFALSIGLTALAKSAETDINILLNTSTYKVVDTGDGTTDTEYFKKKTNSISSFMTQKMDIIEQVSDEGTVLLKNDKDTLPISKNDRVTLLGKASYNSIYGGSSGNAAIGNMGNTNINLTFKSGFEKAGLSVNADMWAAYAEKNVAYSATPDQEVDISELPMSTIKSSDTAVVVLGRVTGEGADAAAGYYELDAKELALVKEAETRASKVVVIINSPSAVAINALKNDEKVGAILQIGGLGALGTKSIGKILVGDVNPSGHLTDTYAANSMSSAAYQTAGTVAYTNADAITSTALEMGVGAGGDKYTVFSEGIYVGYKYYETLYESSISNPSSVSGVKTYMGESTWDYDSEVDYSFGYGMSYSNFTQEIVNFEVKDNVVNMSVKVTNKGTRPGKDTVQLYVQSPYTDYDKTNEVEKSAIQLVTFGKTKKLEQNDSDIVSLKMDLYNIASWDYKTAKSWILDAGDYYFSVGNGAHDALNNVLKSQGKNVDGDASLTKSWTNETLKDFSTYQFTENGFTTAEGNLYHNNVETKYTNRLDNANLNNLVGDKTVKYMTRSDWSTIPTSIPSVTATQNMIDRIQFKTTYTAGEAVGDTYKYGQDTAYQLVQMMGKEYDDPEWDLILDQLMVEEMIATVGKNFSAIDPILSLGFKGTTDNDGVGSGPCANYPSSYDSSSTVIDGVDKYSTINARMYPSQTVEASTFNKELIYDLGEIMSEDCLYVGYTTLWGPGLNLHRHPYSGRNFEYFSEDSMMTYIMGAEITAGVQSNGVICGPKHFAFNDQETDRYGFAVYTNEQAGRENSLRGFEGAVAVAKAKNIMTSLNRVGCDWVGASTALQNEILRDEWGFDGYTITDNALEQYMNGYTIALGNDKLMLLAGNNRDSVLNKQTLLNDVNLFAGVRQACHRILYVYANSVAMNGSSSSTKIVQVTPWWQSALTYIDVILGCLAALSLVGYIAFYGNGKKEEN